MSQDALVVLPLGALGLWLALFLITAVDHCAYRMTYGRFLARLDGIERDGGATRVGVSQLDAHMRDARTGYLARYLAQAGSARAPAGTAAKVYLEREGEATVLKRAQNFGGRNMTRQITALYALARTGHSQVLPLLEESLASSRSVLAYAALDMLEICDSIESAEVLVRSLDSGVLPASRIATQLEHFGTELNALYISRLRQDHPRSRYWIAYLLGKSSYSIEADEILSGLLSDPEAGVRKMALASLGFLGAPSLRERAISMTADPVFFVRTQAIRLLAGFPELEVGRVLLSMLPDSNDAVQLAVKNALVGMGPAIMELLAGARLESDDITAGKLDEVMSTIQSATSVGKSAVNRA
ncbi:MAG: HEAT repeat domain-containing protein [Thermomonas sp.]